MEGCTTIRPAPDSLFWLRSSRVRLVKLEKLEGRVPAWKLHNHLAALLSIPSSLQNKDFRDRSASTKSKAQRDAAVPVRAFPERSSTFSIESSVSTAGSVPVQKEHLRGTTRGYQ